MTPPVSSKPVAYDFSDVDHSALPLIKTLVIALGPPGQSGLTPPPPAPGFLHTSAMSLLPYKVTLSPVPGTTWGHCLSPIAGTP